jgi:hypothetical protein
MEGEGCGIIREPIFRSGGGTSLGGSHYGQPFAQAGLEFRDLAPSREPRGQAKEGFFAEARQDEGALAEGREGFGLDLGVASGDEHGRFGVGGEGEAYDATRLPLGLAGDRAGVDDDEIRGRRAVGGG